jgi:hypothetical protein
MSARPALPMLLSKGYLPPLKVTEHRLRLPPSGIVTALGGITGLMYSVRFFQRIAWNWP